MLIRPTNILVVYPYVLVGLSARLDLKPSMRGCPRSPFLLTDAKGGSRAIDNAWRWSVMEDDDDAPTRHAHRSESEIPDLTPPKIKSVWNITEICYIILSHPKESCLERIKRHDLGQVYAPSSVLARCLLILSNGLWRPDRDWVGINEMRLVDKGLIEIGNLGHGYCLLLLMSRLVI
ncbi:hypothetical protein BHM03_00025552 [Ensete ventricosum]|nr:hypothetical protein BHM03_00025552 [Ensete ventricosum]